ncbi:MAG: hypothetical protein EOP61_05070 [Sphingomonadales bacterium]|nr:MAG: hypothetical protein EOP61_05070 [Sphingomonadales bacterium]
MADDRVVSVGFLTQNDLHRLGATFERHFPIADDNLFAELISKLDKIDAEPFGNGVVLMPHPKA